MIKASSSSEFNLNMFSFLFFLSLHSYLPNFIDSMPQENAAPWDRDALHDQGRAHLSPSYGPNDVAMSTNN